jgi:hypothetical protein
MAPQAHPREGRYFKHVSLPPRKQMLVPLRSLPPLLTPSPKPPSPPGWPGPRILDKNRGTISCCSGLLSRSLHSKYHHDVSSPHVGRLSSQVNPSEVEVTPRTTSDTCHIDAREPRSQPGIFIHTRQTDISSLKPHWACNLTQVVK